MAWFVAVCIVAGAAGAVLLSRLAGALITRVLGSALFVGGLAAILTYYRSYWLPGRYADQLNVVAPVIALIGLAAVLLAGRPRLTFGGVSLTAGLLALGSMATAAANLPELGSYERADLTIAALALAFLAVGGGLAAIRAALRPAAAAVGVLGAILTVVAGQDGYPIYGEPREQTVSVAVTVTGVVTLLGLAGAALARSARPRPGTPASPTPPPSPPREPAAPAPGRDAPASGQAAPAPAPVPPPIQAPAPAPAGGPPVRVGLVPAGRTRLEFAATLVGLVTGVIVLVRELVALVRSLTGS